MLEKKIIQEYFQPKIGRKIRIFSLGRKNNILIKKRVYLSSLLKLSLCTEPLVHHTHLTYYSYQQITICIAYSCLADFDRDVFHIGGKYEGRYDFFMAVFVIGWVAVLFVFFVFLLTLESQLMTEKNWNIIVSILL